MTNQNNKLYQLTCLFNPSIGIEKINETIEKIKQKIISKEGSISEKNYSPEPSKKRLAYLIDKQQEAFYWNLNFLFSPKEVEKLKNNISQGKNILRCIITNKKEIKEKPIKESIDLKMIDKIEHIKDEKVPMAKPSRILDTKGVGIKAIKEKVEIEELDKKLEEILNQ